MAPKRRRTAEQEPHVDAVVRRLREARLRQLDPHAPVAGDVRRVGPAEPFRVRVARALRAMRLAAGLSQSELARRVGTDRSTVHRIEAAMRMPRDELVNAWETVTLGRVIG